MPPPTLPASPALNVLREPRVVIRALPLPVVPAENELDEWRLRELD